MHVRRLAISLLAACAFAPVPAAAAAQQPQHDPVAYTLAMSRLATGDTLDAIEDLRRAISAAPRFGPAYLRLGSLLSRRAGEADRERRERLEVERLLRQAHRLLGNEPEVLAEIGVLHLRQHKLTDARRVLERAWETAERKGRALEPALRAQMHYALARVLETWWEDWQNLFQVPPGARGLVHCANLSGPAEHADAAVACPGALDEQIARMVPLADLKSQERAEMIAQFQLALHYDPAHVDAGVRLLGHLADSGDWEEYHARAERLLLVAPEDPRVHLFIGLGLHERGRSSEADGAFRMALALLPEQDRRVFDDVEPLLPRRMHAQYASLDGDARAEVARTLFAAKDPLFLTAVEERRLEHYARLAWAELKFGAPRSGLRGWDSDRGRIWVRYGAPALWYQSGYATTGMPGRRVYWVYGPSGPVFVFDRRITYRRARFTETSARLARELAGTTPEAYRPRAVTALHAVPQQLARFRGIRSDVTRVEIYAELPVDSIAASADDAAVEAGIFVFDRDMEPLWEHRHPLPKNVSRLPVTYRYEVPRGRYLYGVEARAPGPDSVPRPLARAREWLDVDAFPAGELAVSDLVLAHSVEPLVPEPKERGHFRVVPNPHMTYGPDDPVALYFEIYNLLPDAEHFASFELELVVTIEEIERTGHALAQILGELADKWGFTQEGTDAMQVRFRREAQVLARDLVPEYFRIQVPSLPAGRFRARLIVRDRNADRSVETERVYRIRDVRKPAGAAGPGSPPGA